MKLYFFGKKQEKKIAAILVGSPSGGKILLDCGCSPKNIDECVIPENLISDIDAIFLTHAHLDHWGYLPWIIENNYKNSIYMTSATYDLLENYAIKESFNRIRENDKDQYKDLIYKMRNLINTLDYGDPIIIKNFKIYFLPANHILGSAQILLEEIDTKKQILYTGDFNPANNYLYDSINLIEMKNKFNIEIKPHFVIIECSNVDLKESEYKAQEENFIKLINEAYNNMGNVLIPCKALGNAQEFLIRYLYYCLNKNLSMPYEIFTIGSLSAVNNVYLKYREEFIDPTLIDYFRTNMIIKNFEDYIKNNFSNIEDLFFENSRDYGIKLFVATGGDPNIGSSKRIYNNLKNSPVNLIITTKYPRKIKCRAKTVNLKLFSLHGNFDAILKYIQDLKALNSSNYFLIHGSRKNLELMNQCLNKLNIKNYIPEVGENLKIGVG